MKSIIQSTCHKILFKIIYSVKPQLKIINRHKQTPQDILDCQGSVSSLNLPDSDYFHFDTLSNKQGYRALGSFQCVFFDRHLRHEKIMNPKKLS